MGSAVEDRDTVSLASVEVTFSSQAEEVRALRQVSFTAAPGTLTAVMGESGSGKSTLLNVIAGLQTVTAGQVLVAGQDLADLSEDQRADLRLNKVGVVFQDDNLIASFTALENVTLPLRARGWSAKQADAEARQWLGKVGLADLAARRPAEMSGGQRQRVGVARALAGGRRILVADEPTGALDSENTETLFALLGQLASEGKAVVVATHDRSIRGHADRVLTMRDGSMTGEDAPALESLAV